MNDLIQTGFDYAALPVESVDRLKTWKTEIAAFTDTVESSLVQIGLRFQKAQDELSQQGIKGDGFVAWIESETKYSCSSAYNLINVSTRFKDKPFPNFGKSVIYALSAPSTPDSVIDRALEKAESGEKVTVADVKDWKAEEARWKETVAYHQKLAESTQNELALEARQRELLATPALSLADVVFKLETSIGEIDDVCSEPGDYESMALLKLAVVALRAGSVATVRRLVDKALDGEADYEFAYEGAAAALADLQRLSP